MSERLDQVGFSQRIRLEWLELTANMVLAGHGKDQINDGLRQMLESTVSVGGNSIRGTREKAITILLKTWVSVPSELRILRDEGLEILQGLASQDRIAVHWGMSLASYPFWGTVASYTGRLLRLQESAAAAHVQRRVKEQYGERETASRATRRILRSFIDWGVLNETYNKGVYVQGKRYAVKDPKLITWLAEASLQARSNQAADVKDLLDNPSIFPFTLAHLSAEQMISLSPRLDVLRHGLDDNLVMLREQPKDSRNGIYKKQPRVAEGPNAITASDSDKH